MQRALTLRISWRLRLSLMALWFGMLPAAVATAQPIDDSVGPSICCGSHDCPEEDAFGLTGEWGGRRSHAAEHGITFDADITQFYFGVVAGGVDREFRYGGHGDYVMNVDLSKMGGPQGLSVKLRAEHRFGEAIGPATGAIMPAAVLADLPVADSTNLYLTNVLFTQMFSETVGVFFGKLDTLDGDLNAFAHGRGKTQFSNMAFVANPIALRSVVYSTLGAGFIVLREGEPLFTFTMLNSTDTAKSSGFGELFAEGATLVAELRLPTSLFDMPGHQLFAGSWNSRDYVSFGQDPRVILPSVPIAQQAGSWSLYWNFDQYLYVDPCDERRGWGLFGRAGIADDKTNLIESFLSFGIGGNSIIAGREHDRFGVGWYRTNASSELGPFLAVLGSIGDGQGWELFYNAQVTPWFHVTADLQMLDSMRQRVDTAWVAGLRANVRF